MALSEEQKQKLTNKFKIIEPADSGIDASISQAFDKFHGNAPTSTGFVQGVKEDLTKRGENIVESAKKELGPDGTPLGGVRLGLRTAGQVAGSVADVGFQALKKVGEVTGITKVVKEEVAPALAPVGEFILDSELGQKGLDALKGGIESYQSFAEEHPDTANALEDVINVAEIIPGVKTVKKLATGTANIAKKGAGAITEAVVETGEKIAPVLQEAKDFVNPALEFAKNIPSRVGTNITDKKLTEKAIQAIPSKPAQNAVRNGTDILDAKTILSTPKAQKPSLKKLYDVVVDTANGIKKTDPHELVGKPIVTKLNTLKKQVTKLGGELDTVATSLKGKVLKQHARILKGADESLGKLGIKVVDGKLDFKGSALEGVGLNKEIANVYKRLQSAKDSNDFHNLKKFIDNNVAFGKTSQNLTGDAERLLKVWRKNIDGALDKQFPKYNKVNNELASRLGPIKELNKFLKDSGFDEDILNMKAGLLAKRIASNSQSNPALRQMLRNLDKATKVKGKTSLNVESLVDFFGILEKQFPEIIGKQSFRGQITSGIENATGGITDALVKGVKEVAGQTGAVKRKAFNDFINDVFK